MTIWPIIFIETYGFIYLFLNSSQSRQFFFFFFIFLPSVNGIYSIHELHMVILCICTLTTFSCPSMKISVNFYISKGDIIWSLTILSKWQWHDFHKRHTEKWEITFTKKLCWNMENVHHFCSQNNLYSESVSHSILSNSVWPHVL